MSRTVLNPQHRLPSRSGDWWVADEEPEVVTAEPGARRLFPRWHRHRFMMLIALAAGVLFSALLL